MGGGKRGRSSFERVHVHFWLRDPSGFTGGGGGSLLPPGRHNRDCIGRTRSGTGPVLLAPFPSEDSRAAPQERGAGVAAPPARTDPSPPPKHRRGSERAQSGAAAVTKVSIPLSLRCEAEAGGTDKPVHVSQTSLPEPGPARTLGTCPCLWEPGNRAWASPAPFLLPSPVPAAPGVCRDLPCLSRGKPSLPRKPLREGSPLG